MRRVLRSGLTATALVVLYAVAPVGTIERSLVAWSLFVAGLGALVVLLASLVRHRRSSPDETDLRVESVAAVGYAIVAFFALVYVYLARQPHQFAGLHDRVDALYFTMATLATVGYGDVHPVGTAARAVVTAQIFFDLTFLAFAARVIGPSLHLRRTERTGSPGPGEASGDRPGPP